MDYQTIYRKVLAVLLLLLIFVFDLAAVHQLFPNVMQVTLFGAVLGIQTLLILEYHKRCLDCEGCMDHAGAGIYLFYKVFAAIGFFSVLLTLLHDSFSAELHQVRFIVAFTYAALLIMGVSTAFKAIIGVKKVADCNKRPSKQAGSKPNKVLAKALEDKALADWDDEERKRRAVSLETQKKQAAKRRQARKRLAVKSTIVKEFCDEET